MKTSTAIAVLVALVAVFGIGWWFFTGTKAPTTPTDDTQALASAAFACSGGKSVGAVFYPGSIALTLSDGRTMTLNQGESASGIRYVNADESFVFWGKGNTAFVTEGANQDETYSGCIVVAPDPSGTLTQIFATSSPLGISLRFPQGYTLDRNYIYQALGPGKNISGIKITIPAAAAAGTNLSSDTYVSVEEIPGATTCSADLFLDINKSSSFTDSGVEYSVATTTGAAAGNIYDEAVFAIPGSSPCTAVRYYIHSTNIGNYDPGTVREFDKVGVINEFDNIRRSLVLGR